MPDARPARGAHLAGMISRCISRRALVAAAILAFSSAGLWCGGAAADDVALSNSSVGAALGSHRRKPPCTAGAPCPPPAQCYQRKPGVTALQAVVRIDRYRGLVRGRNGTHEIAVATLLSTPWVYDPSLLDTKRVELAMNVANSADPKGLPHEVRLDPGQSIEVEGEYIPASAAHAHDANGATVAVVHYTHAPCGYVIINGRTYR
jgi:hypothetical protein